MKTLRVAEKLLSIVLLLQFLPMASMSVGYAAQNEPILVDNPRNPLSALMGNAGNPQSPAFDLIYSGKKSTGIKSALILSDDTVIIGGSIEKQTGSGYDGFLTHLDAHGNLLKEYRINPDLGDDGAASIGGIVEAEDHLLLYLRDEIARRDLIYLLYEDGTFKLVTDLHINHHTAVYDTKATAHGLLLSGLAQDYKDMTNMPWAAMIGFDGTIAWEYTGPPVQDVQFPVAEFCASTGGDGYALLCVRRFPMQYTVVFLDNSGCQIGEKAVELNVEGPENTYVAGFMEWDDGILLYGSNHDPQTTAWIVHMNGDGNQVKENRFSGHEAINQAYRVSNDLLLLMYPDGYSLANATGANAITMAWGFSHNVLVRELLRDSCDRIWALGESRSDDNNETSIIIGTFVLR